MVTQVFTAMANSFAHGSNDVANSVGPFAAIWGIYLTGTVQVGLKSHAARLSCVFHTSVMRTTSVKERMSSVGAGDGWSRVGAGAGDVWLQDHAHARGQGAWCDEFLWLIRYLLFHRWPS